MKAMAKSSQGWWVPGGPPRGQRKDIRAPAECGRPREQLRLEATLGPQTPPQPWGYPRPSSLIPSPLRCCPREGKEGVNNPERLGILPQRT